MKLKTMIDRLIADPSAVAKVIEAGRYAKFLSDDIWEGYGRRVGYVPDGPDPTNRLFFAIERLADGGCDVELSDIAEYIAERLKPRPAMAAAA